MKSPFWLKLLTAGIEVWSLFALMLIVGIGPLQWEWWCLFLGMTLPTALAHTLIEGWWQDHEARHA